MYSAVVAAASPVMAVVEAAASSMVAVVEVPLLLVPRCLLLELYQEPLALPEPLAATRLMAVLVWVLLPEHCCRCGCSPQTHQHT